MRVSPRVELELIVFEDSEWGDFKAIQIDGFAREPTEGIRQRTDGRPTARRPDDDDDDDDDGGGGGEL